MKILILITSITWSFGGGYQQTPSYETVGSAKTAAIRVYFAQELAKQQVEPDQKEHQLYEIDLEKKTIKEIPIPIIGFENKKPN